MGAIFAFFCSKGNIDIPDIKESLNTMRHRGGSKNKYYEDSFLKLGFSRNDKIKKSEESIFFSRNQRYLSVLDGNIYNVQNLIKKYKIQKNLKTNVDSEIIPHIFEIIGVNIFKEILGAFSMIIYDRDLKKLYVSRDKAGLKPIFYSRIKEGVMVSSEIKGLLKSNLIQKKVNIYAIHQYLIHGFAIPDPLTGYKGINKLQISSYLEVYENEFKTQSYWKPDYSKKLNYKNLEEYSENFLSIFEDVFSDYLRDLDNTNTGAYLSGGLDSSATSYFTSQKIGNINTYCVTEDNENYSDPEGIFSKKVSKLISSNHNIYNFTYKDLKLLPDIIDHFDEPVAATATIFQYLINKNKNINDNVLISGYGSDSLFGISNGIFKQNNIYKYFDKFISKSNRKIINNHIFKNGPYYGNFKILKVIQKLFNDNHGRYFFSFEKKAKIYEEFFDNNLIEKIQNNYVNLQYEYCKDIKIKEFFDLQPLEITYVFNVHSNSTIADMGCSKFGTEIRSPFMDERVLNFAAKLPLKSLLSNPKNHSFSDKLIVKKAFEKYLPNDVIYREKLGYGGYQLMNFLSFEWSLYINYIFNNSFLVKHGILKEVFILSLIKRFNPNKEYITLKKTWNYWEDCQEIIKVLVLEIWYRVKILNRLEKEKDIASNFLN